MGTIPAEILDWFFEQNKKFAFSYTPSMIVLITETEPQDLTDVIKGGWFIGMEVEDEKSGMWLTRIYRLID